MSLGKSYDFKSVEEKWREKWFKDNTFKWVKKKGVEDYVIDTPPPYPYRKLHAGNFFNSTYHDFIARYYRLKGFNVLQPWGWDCHGLPAEIHIEKTTGKTAKTVGVEKFKELCKQNLLENIDNIRDQIKKVGISIDWDKQYVTMSDEYKAFVQRTFLEMVEKGFIYRSEHPVSWCVSCHSSIAEAQTDKEEMSGVLHYIKLPLKKGGHVVIATTRPELMPSCVSVFVHPSDERYKHLVGETVVVPFFGREVVIRSDESVDPEFGTGVVYHCTFGDKEDYMWVVKYGLPIVKSLDESGLFNENAGFLKGLTVREARERIVQKLKEEGLWVKSEPVKHVVSVCERCKTPLEIISKKQWFFATTKLRDDIKRVGAMLEWFPNYMVHRLNDWVDGVLWDWVISRQRFWATPFPVWYCERCGLTVFADKKELPVDPQKVSRKCSECGSVAVPERDVMDTWMDSSVSALWLEEKWVKSGGKFLTSLRSQGEDIIRTWLFYSLARSIPYGKIPWKQVLINGMVLGTDGAKMSKRKNNVVEPDELIEKYGADVFRQWVGKSLPGNDWPLDFKEFERGKKFLNKLWNVARFCERWIKTGDVKPSRFADKWILNKLEELKKVYVKSMDEARFSVALEAVRSFVWHEFADYYVEMVKKRLYEEGDEVAGIVLGKVLRECLLLLAPFTPFITEELYNHLFSSGESVHLQRLSEVGEVDEKLLERGELLKALISRVRGSRTEKRIKHSTPVRVVLDEDVSDELVEELKDTVNAVSVSFGEVFSVQPVE